MTEYICGDEEPVDGIDQRVRTTRTGFRNHPDKHAVEQGLGARGQLFEQVDSAQVGNREGLTLGQNVQIKATAAVRMGAGLTRRRLSQRSPGTYLLAFQPAS